MSVCSQLVAAFGPNERHPARLRRDPATTRLVVDGLRHSGQSCVVATFSEDLQARMASHTHSISSLLWALWHGIPAFVVVREPLAQAYSCWARGIVPQATEAIDPPTSLLTALVVWVAFHLAVTALPVRVLMLSRFADAEVVNAFVGVKPPMPRVNWAERVALSVAGALYRRLAWA